MQDKKHGMAKYIQVAAAFGISTALRIYILGVLAGGWLDNKLETSPWCRLAGVVLAIFLSFKFLLDQFAALEKDRKGKGE
ncbi:MAG: AtpZ/AtpI family protein [Desulfitobacteriaceae bacterium]|nr:AtpZ/AtpI family protein [Desulfitobacteriaceae bacterium]MDD4752567.1 AtpZ/AtpI family protein [Desulfitobacteriaceae bacterium]